IERPLSSPICDEIVHERRWGYDMIWRYEAHRHDVFGCDNGGLASHGDNRIEISRCQSVRKVAEIVSKKCGDQREVGAQRCLNQVIFSVDIDPLFAFLNNRADSGRGQYSAKAKTAGTNAFDESALRDEVDGHLSSDHLLLRLGIESDVTCDGPADQAFIDELSYTTARNRRIICNHR